MLPTKDTPTEMGVAYFNLFLPEVIKKFIVFSTIGLFVTVALYMYVRLYRKATLTFEQDQIKIIGKSINLIVKITTLKKVTFMDDSKEVAGELKEKFTIYFEQKLEKSIRLRLTNYSELSEFMDEFLRYENIKYEFLNITISPDLENEI